MDPVKRIEGIAAALPRENIDTDAIIPSRDITSPSREGFGDKLFSPWRYLGPEGAENPDFVLNREPWRQARILIAGRNFGCGSSREMAVWALLQFGLRCVIAPSFGSIFRNNAVRNALLTVELPADVVAGLCERAGAEPLSMVVDLQICEVRLPDGAVHRFGFNAADREMLLSGMDAIERTWQHRDAIERFEAQDRQRRPWVW